MTEPTGKASVRSGLVASTAFSLALLWIAAFETPFSDFPEGFLAFALALLMGLPFLGCCIWSVLLLRRVRRDGVKFAVPLLICALTVLLLAIAPFKELWLQRNFWWYLSDRKRIVARVEAGELKPNLSYNSALIALGDGNPTVSAGGNDIVVERTETGTYVLFLTLRGFRHAFSGFLHVPPGGDPAQFFEFEDQPPRQVVQYGKGWYFVAN